MRQVKIFKTVETEVSELEGQVNAWIEETGAKIISISGNIAPQSSTGDGKAIGLSGSQFASSDVMLIVLYETSDG